MNLIDKAILEWSYRTVKGYPDINNQNDLDIFEKTFGFSLTENSERKQGLSYEDLIKPFPPRHELLGQYDDRGERFLEKIMKGDPFDLKGSDSSVVIDPEKSEEAIEALQKKNYIAFKGASGIKFVTDDGKTISIGKLFKSAEFGGGKGSGGGSTNTRVQESAMALVCAIAWLNKKAISASDLSDENISQGFEKVDVDATREEITEFLRNEKSWMHTFVSSANLLLSSFYNPNFVFHRGSKFEKSIYNAYKTAKKEAEITMNNDKWNPADIWLVDSSMENYEFPTNLTQLNGMLVEFFSSKKIVGVSLKKATKNPSLKVINLSKSDFQGRSYEGFDMRSTNNNLKLLYDGGSMTFRNFRFGTNYAGEIDGKKAQHGKLGLGPINDNLKINNLQLLPSSKDVAAKFNDGDEELVKDFKELFLNYVDKADEKVFDEIMSTKDMNYKSSKFLSLKLLDIIENADKKIQDELVSDMIRYASSMSKLSSVHVKVS